jgi:hypothetical protein
MTLTAPAPDPAIGRDEPPDQTSRPGRQAVIDIAVIAIAVALWLIAVHRTRIASVGDFGLLATVSPLFFVALALTVAGFLAEIIRGARRAWAMISYTVLLIFLLHGTAPALLSEPEYAWTYKHIGVIEVFLRNGRVIDHHDLYQEWPALFAGVAWLAKLSGADPIRLAQWAPVFFNLAASVILLAIGRTLTTDRRIPYLMVFGFQCINWVEEDYLSPQGFAFVLSLGALLVALRWLRTARSASPPEQPGRARSWLERRQAWLTSGLPAMPSTGARVRAWALVAFTVVLGVLTASHQLSPYLIVLDIAVLTLAGLVAPWWTALLALAVPVLYLIPRFGLVSGNFKIFESLDIFHNAQGNGDGWGTAGQAFSAIVVRVLALGVWAFALLRIWLAVRERKTGLVLAPALLAFTPFLLLFAQSYGGEAIYRVFLFSAPWCAYLLADLGVLIGARIARSSWWHPPSTASRSRWTVGSATGLLIATMLTGALALATMQGRHGQLTVDRQSRASVVAADYLYAHGTPGATIMLAAPDFPSRLAANYNEFNRTVPVGEPDLITGALLKHVILNDEYLPSIENFAHSFHGSTTYLVISDEMRRYAQYFGVLPAGSLSTLSQTLSSAPNWSVFYRNSDVTIFQLHG